MLLTICSKLPASPSLSHPLKFPRFSRKHRHQIPRSLSHVSIDVVGIPTVEHFKQDIIDLLIICLRKA